MPRASRLETLGAWLHVWTPPRDCYVPPPPSGRRFVITAVALAVSLAAVLAVAVALIERGKERGATTRQRAQAAFAASERARLRVDQAPHDGRGPAVPLGAAPARVLAARARLLNAMQRSVTADMQSRVRRHLLDSRVSTTLCQPFVRPSVPNPPQPPPAARTAAYECTAVTGALDTGFRRASVVTGYPVWARVDFRSSRYVWCKINRRPGEHGTGQEVFVPLAPACDLLR
jgi:hypothetical protein